MPIHVVSHTGLHTIFLKSVLKSSLRLRSRLTRSSPGQIASAFSSRAPYGRGHGHPHSRGIVHNMGGLALVGKTTRSGQSPHG